MHQMEPSVFGHISAMALLAVLGFAILSERKRASLDRISIRTVEAKGFVAYRDSIAYHTMLSNVVAQNVRGNLADRV